MIVVKVELHSAITGRVSEIGRMHIINDGTGTKSRGNYIVELIRRGTVSVLQRTATVSGHARLSTPVFKLVGKAIAEVYK